MSPVATRGVRDISMVAVSLRVAVVVESVWVFATALTSMTGHAGPASLRVAQARHRLVINDNRV
jgi:hypothetical protein